jgi:hypothetical protein
MTDKNSCESDAPVVAIIPYGTKLTLRLADMPLDHLSWPLRRPERLKHGTVSNMRPDDHLLASVTSRLLYMPRPGVKARVSVMVVEPQAVHGRYIAWLKVLWWRFYRVLASNHGLLAAVPNGERFLYGSTWVLHFHDLKIRKTAMLS